MNKTGRPVDTPPRLASEASNNKANAKPITLDSRD